MSTKTDITNSINTINDGGLNTASEVRATLNTLKDNAYGDRITEKDTSSVKVVTSENTINTSLGYQLTFVKQGRFVNVQGFLINNSASIVGDSAADDYFFEIISSEFLPVVASTYKFPNGNEFIKVENNKIYYSSIGAGVSKKIAFTYFTQD